MYGKKDRAGPIHQDRLGAVAVVHVKVEHRNFLGAGRERLERGDRNRVQITKAHRVVPRGVMARRTQEAEGRFPGARGLERVQRASDRAARVGEDVRMRRGIAVEVSRG